MRHFCRCIAAENRANKAKNRRNMPNFGHILEIYGRKELKITEISSISSNFRQFFIDLISSKISRIWAIYCPNERFLMEFALETRCSGKKQYFSGFSGFQGNLLILPKNL